MIHQEFYPTLISEQYTFNYYYENQDEEKGKLWETLFFSVQFAYLIVSGNFIKKTFGLNEFVLFFIVALLISLLVFFRFAVYKSMMHLLPRKVDIDYYIFNYRFTFLYIGFFAFILIAVNRNLNILKNHEILYLLFFVFYIWLLFRWLLISVRYKVVKSIYFFLYLCTLEILPILILFSV